MVQRQTQKKSIKLKLTFKFYSFMNKKILFAALSIAALTACSTDEFESQNVAEGTTSPVQFEVINNQFDDLTRASMSGNKIVWNANDGDLFTLYHGAAALGDLTGYENATYTAQEGEAGSAATLTTPSMIKAGGAVMVWPVDSTFRITPTSKLSITIPAEQTNVVNNIPYMSDLVDIHARLDDPTYGLGEKNEAGLNRKYPVYMRPMASQLNIKADYATTDETIATLYKGDDPIDTIRVTSVDLSTKAGGTKTLFTTEIPVKFTAPTGAIAAQWAAAEADNAWNQVVDFDLTGTLVQSNMLTATEESVTDNYSCKILLLPQDDINTATGGLGVEEGAVVVNTIYGSVVVADPSVTVSSMTNPMTSKYTTGEIADAWYRYLPADESKLLAGEKQQTYEAKATTAGTDGLYKTTTNVMQGMMQTIDVFSAYKAKDGVVKGEPVGTAATRNVKVLLTHLDMSNLHIKKDKQLRDAARVWQKLGLDGVTVYLDGDATTGEFAMSQKTIETINNINAGIAADADKFKVMPCKKAGEACTTIVITDNDDNQNIQNLTFIRKNGTQVADIAFADEAKAWKWNDVVLINATTDVNTFINRGTMENTATATLNVGIPGTPFTPVDVELINNGTWTIGDGTNNATLNVQFDVTNNGIVNISEHAQYRQDGTGHIFTNEATDKPSRFGGTGTIGYVENKGVFATVDGGNINNYGLIEHAAEDAKTYVTNNQVGGAFGTAFGAGNKMGRINLPFSNKDEDNISVSAKLAQGFISVTVTKEELTKAGISSTDLDASIVGEKVNYIIVNSGIKTISAVSAQVKYLEINEPGTEIAWAVTTPTTYTGLIVKSPVNIKLGTTITATVTYLDGDMYVGGTFNNRILATPADPVNAPKTKWSGYYGDTSTNVATKYITY